MNIKSSYKPELGLACVEDSRSGIRVITLLLQPGEKKAAIMAYVGARLSRSDANIVDIAREVIKKFGGVKAGERISTIVNTYGHASVADMSHNMIFIERVPMVTAMRFFYLNPVQDGQERSTRFQNFSNPDLWIPEFENTRIEDKYEVICRQQVADYVSLKEQTYDTLKRAYNVSEENKGALEARTLDTLRHFLPMGMRTNFCAIMSSRNWARYIGMMNGSTQQSEQIVGKLLFTLLTGNEDLKKMGYVPESDELIKYADASTQSYETIDKIIEAYNMLSGKLPYNVSNEHHKHGIYRTNPVKAFIEHIELIGTGSSILDYEWIDVQNNFFTQIGKLIFANHNDKKQLGTIFQSGALQIASTLDIGALKDFNRQRSTERFIPYLENNTSAQAVLSNGSYKLCDYLTSLKTPMVRVLKNEYDERFNRTYSNIIDLHKSFGGLTLEQMRCILPHAHNVPYRLYASLDDMLYVQNLRTRPGGHINYRMETYRFYQWMQQNTDIEWLNILWNQMELPKPDPLNEEQFVDRR